MTDPEIEGARDLLDRYLRLADRVGRTGTATTIQYVSNGLYNAIAAASENLREIVERKQWEYL